MRSPNALPSSFRDPSGFLFSREGLIYRQINVVYGEHYDHLIESGLYKELVDSDLLVPHEEVDAPAPAPQLAYRVIRPERIPFISYPYEWCFSQLRAAALATLRIQERAMKYGMSLRDANAYNIQFRGCKPLLIDTLSFEKYREGEPWVAYRQFCEHFLAPLALMRYRDVRLGQLQRTCTNGVPVDLASGLLPWRTWFRFPMLLHIHLHAKSQRRFADRQPAKTKRRMSRLSLLGLIDSLKSAVSRCIWRPPRTEWSHYYDDTNYTPAAAEHKRRIVADLLREASPSIVWDLGGNVGLFSRLATEAGAYTLSFDVDPAAVEQNFQRGEADGDTQLLPLVLDLTNPSPGVGWAHEERMSLQERGPADVVMALALIHHLAITNNLPFAMIASFFRSLTRHLIIEFVPKSDSNVQRLLSTREDIFTEYCQEAFERDFAVHFEMAQRIAIQESERVLYLWRAREPGA